jgi:hypothetical protein
MDDLSVVFRDKLSGQAEICARKALEWLQKDLQLHSKLDPESVYYLACAAEILLSIRDKYGKK